MSMREEDREAARADAEWGEKFDPSTWIKAELDETEAEDEESKDEEPELTTMTGGIGSMLPHVTASRGGITYPAPTSTSSGVYASGGFVGPTSTHVPYGPYTPAVPGAGMGWTTTSAPPAVPTKAKAKLTDTVTLPPRFTEKVLLAFLEEQEEAEDSVVWAAHLKVTNVEMRLVDGEIKLFLEFSLKDEYGNVEK